MNVRMTIKPTFQLWRS